ncbi:hypothetical protein BN2475_600040 [Paraburkholderia ribeironis]|uniref:Uncharacterized protein n=1 Tax=Paraburkholderia ribeironis TaxID=1247936 RepID=A0A1N7SEY7_9BURK|nr:hypothetical protein BN2475_600040 [Paraburkholderia ribeironis]
MDRGRNDVAHRDRRIDLLYLHGGDYVRNPTHASKFDFLDSAALILVLSWRNLWKSQSSTLDRTKIMRAF